MFSVVKTPNNLMGRLGELRKALPRPEVGNMKRKKSKNIYILKLKFQDEPATKPDEEKSEIRKSLKQKVT